MSYVEHTTNKTVARLLCDSYEKHTGMISTSMDFDDTAVACALLLRLRKKKQRKGYWVHPIYSERLLKGKFYTLYSDLRQYPSKFFSYFRMSIDSFDELLSHLRPSISYKNTTWRRAVPAEERLVVTLR